MTDGTVRYDRIRKAVFRERPNRFIAYMEIDGKRETVHVKNTGRCAELLVPGATAYVQESENPRRKTRWDLIAVEKGDRLINMDSQIPNRAAEEWIRAGNLFENVTRIRPETVYGQSRFDLYVEAEGRKIFIEVKGVTLEREGACLFPDAPSQRAVKHMEELIRACGEGYEAYVLFVIQMEGVRYFAPNEEMHPAFAEALREAAKAGVKILAWDCAVTPDSIRLCRQVDVVLEDQRLRDTVEPVIAWYQENKRDLPWRKRINAYRVWVSEIMLQQTRVEAVKPYYERFLQELPDVQALARVPEDRLLKLWEGLGYYSRARNLKEAACQIMERYGGRFPETYEEILSLKGIGSYTAGAVASFVYQIPRAAVDGNVLRVVTRILGWGEDITRASVKKEMERRIEAILPKENPGDYNQGLIELGALICLPNGEPKCLICPVRDRCQACREGRQTDYPVKKKAPERRKEKRTIFLFCDARKVAIRKRPSRGLLAGLYEFPGTEGHLSEEEAIRYGQSLGLAPVRIRRLPDARHIFSHVEWEMRGYELLVDELEQELKTGGEIIFADRKELEEIYPIPAAFGAYTESARFS